MHKDTTNHEARKGLRVRSQVKAGMLSPTSVAQPHRAFAPLNLNRRMVVRTDIIVR